MQSLNSENARLTKFKRTQVQRTQRTSKIALVLGLAMLMSSVAWGLPGQNGDRRGYRSRLHQGGQHARRCFGGGCDRQGVAGQAAQPTSSVPEPTAALLYAAGGLMVAQAIRSRRKRA